MATDRRSHFLGQSLRQEWSAKLNRVCLSFNISLFELPLIISYFIGVACEISLEVVRCKRLALPPGVPSVFRETQNGSTMRFFNLYLNSPLFPSHCFTLSKLHHCNRCERDWRPDSCSGCGNDDQQQWSDAETTIMTEATSKTSSQSSARPDPLTHCYFPNIWPETEENPWSWRFFT